MAYEYTPNPDLKGWTNDHPFPPELEVDSPYLQRRQEQFRQVLVTICQRVVDEGVRFGAIGPRAKRDLAVHFEELSLARSWLRPRCR
jgi:hypothetical protein